MPSIEIVCIDQNDISHFENLPFLVEAENRLVSHRKPHPLFQEEFDEYEGCIYHLRSLMDTGPTAYLLLDTSLECARRAPAPDRDSLIKNLRFLPEYAPSVYALLETLLEASPRGQVLFTSDYQFGPRRRYQRPMKLDKFWALHDAGRLHMNALYPLYHHRRAFKGWTSSTGRPSNSWTVSSLVLVSRLNCTPAESSYASSAFDGRAGV